MDFRYTLKTESIVTWFGKKYRAAVPNLFGTRDQYCGRQFFHRLGVGWDDSSTFHLWCTLFLLLLHQLHLRSSDIRPWGLGTRDIKDERKQKTKMHL